ncbi:hypothetical protein [Promicromonospora sp. NPDC060271]|uniref:hypothetical protein n=1 Tax=Promicromonospora sp. NPDC060271 TaxID=3347089 RepID=UPI00364D752B
MPDENAHDTSPVGITTTSASPATSSSTRFGSTYGTSRPAGVEMTTTGWSRPGRWSAAASSRAWSSEATRRTRAGTRDSVMGPPHPWW